jgi:hypothetical protein
MDSFIGFLCAFALVLLVVWLILGIVILTQVL